MPTAANMETESMPWAWIKAANDIIMQEPWAPEHNRMPVQLLPWLWLSDQMHTHQANKLYELGITHVLSTNAMSELERGAFRDRLKRVYIQHHFVDGDDEECYDMIGLHWRECLAVLKQVQESGGRIVVHCLAGTNRSGLIACAAVMFFERLPLLETLRMVKQKRGMVLTNLSFQRQLCQLAATEDLLGAKPKGYSDDPLPAIVKNKMRRASASKDLFGLDVEAPAN